LLADELVTQTSAAKMSLMSPMGPLNAPGVNRQACLYDQKTTDYLSHHFQENGEKADLAATTACKCKLYKPQVFCNTSNFLYCNPHKKPN